MDRIDRQILKLIQQDAKLNNQTLAERVSLSPSPCLRRVKQLEAQGYIDKYVTVLNPKKLGLELNVLVTVGLTSHDPIIMGGFEEAIKQLPQVVNCYLIAGQSQDYMLRVVSPSLDDYHKILINKITQIKGIRSVQSNFVLREIINTTELPVEHLIKK